MDVPLSNRQFIAVEYPGTVINVKKMVEKFGGEKKLHSCLTDPSKRLELKFRHTDPFSKPAYGDKFTCTNLVIEVVRRKKKNADDSTGTYEVNCLATVNSVFKFKSLVDFQLLPVRYRKEGGAESLLPKLVPKDLYPCTWLEEEDVPLFVTPMIYSRFSNPQDIYKDGRPKQHRKPVQKAESNLIGSWRRKRPAFTRFCTFDAPEVPQAPLEDAVRELQLHPLLITMKQKLDEMFAERPIWTKNSLLMKCNILDRQRIKLPLTCTAYYFSNGPWRTLWVKFGYDPRKDPKAKIYQVMDFRVNSAIPIENEHNRSRSFDYYTLPMKALKITRNAAAIKKDHLIAMRQGTADEQEENIDNNESLGYALLPGQLPTTRQCYFQVCDIYIDKVQRLIHQNDQRERFCHEKDGWCDIGILDKCREVIAREMKAIAQKVERKNTGSTQDQ